MKIVKKFLKTRVSFATVIVMSALGEAGHIYLNNHFPHIF